MARASKIAAEKAMYYTNLATALNEAYRYAIAASIKDYASK